MGREALSDSKDIPKTNIWYRHFVAEFGAETKTLSLEECGALVRLRDHYWYQQSSLPDDDKILAKIVGVPVRKWRKLREVLAPFFVIEDRHWRYPSMDREIQSAREVSKKRREAGKKGAESRWANNKQETIANAMANAIDGEWQTLWQNDRHTQSQLQSQDTTCETKGKVSLKEAAARAVAGGKK